MSGNLPVRIEVQRIEVLIGAAVRVGRLGCTRFLGQRGPAQSWTGAAAEFGRSVGGMLSPIELYRSSSCA
jgi:hypothetical protein